MQLTTAADGCIRVDGVPCAGCTELRFFLNGVRVYSHPVRDVDAGGVSVDVRALVDGADHARPVDAGALLQCYAVGPQEAVLAAAAAEWPDAGVARRAAVAGTTAAPSGADARRLVASAIHAAGDVHRWKFPLRLLAPEAAGDGPMLYTVHLRFDVDVAVAGGTAPVATVTWTLPPGVGSETDRKRPRYPQPEAFGEVRTTTEITAACPASVFAATVGANADPDARAVACEIRASPDAYLVLGALRYVAYGVRLPLGRTPSVWTPPPAAAAAAASAAPVAGKRRAVLVGVSKYTRKQKRISDLEYADDDVVACPGPCAPRSRARTVRPGVALPRGTGLHVHRARRRVQSRPVRGGRPPRTAGYPQWDGPGTVRNVRSAVRRMVEEAGAPEDRLVFVTSSHGCGDGRGASYLCLLPDPQLSDGTASEREGSYMDHELAADLGAGGRNLSRNTVFLDACCPGGPVPASDRLVPLRWHHRGTSGCAPVRHRHDHVHPQGVRIRRGRVRTGSGAVPRSDNATTQSGAWTNRFLTCNLQTVPGNKDADLAVVFQTAVEAYVKEYSSAGDRPCFFGRMPGVVPCNTELRPGVSTIPRKAFMMRQWL